jgi:hypothetical protein
MPACPVALIDRLTHHDEIISIDGKSIPQGNQEEFSKERRLHQTTDVSDLRRPVTQLMCSPRPLAEIKSDGLVVYSRGARTAKLNPFERGSILPWVACGVRWT